MYIPQTLPTEIHQHYDYGSVYVEDRYTTQTVLKLSGQL